MANAQSRIQQLQELVSRYQEYEGRVEHTRRMLDEAENESEEIYKTRTRSNIDAHFRYIVELNEEERRLIGRGSEVLSTIRKIEEQLTPEERKIWLDEKNKKRDLAEQKKRDLAEKQRREQQEKRERDLAEKQRREQQEKQRTLQEAKWRAEGRCMSCGGTLGFWDKLFRRTRCKRCK